MRLFSPILLLLLSINLAHAQGPHWVFFMDDQKGPVSEISPEAELRIEKRGHASLPGTRDVAPDYLAGLREAGFIIRQSSRFLNAASVEVTRPADLNRLHQLPFVKSIQVVARSRPRTLEQPKPDDYLPRQNSLSYGPSLTQNELLHIPHMHDRGYDASGIIIGVFDTGFNTEHASFDRLDVLDQYDFVDSEANAAGGYGHGDNVLSVIGGYAPGHLIGPAYGATYLLARTEDESSETRAEEDNWVAAMEWADARGVDVISSALNYRDFDGSNDDYPYPAMDGETAIITRAANIAAERGILVVNSVANEGPSSGSLWPPADSPHVLAVGSVYSNGSISGFSSRGPTYDGRIKPDVVAMGNSVYVADKSSGYTHANGTSFSAPQVAGLAALLLQAYPSLSPDSIIGIFQQYGDLATHPDNSYGYGIPDLTPFFQSDAPPTIRKATIFPNPSSGRSISMMLEDLGSVDRAVCQIFDLLGRELATLRIKPESSNIIRIHIPPTLILESQILIIWVQFGDQVYTGKFVYVK